MSFSGGELGGAARLNTAGVPGERVPQVTDHCFHASAEAAFRVEFAVLPFLTRPDLVHVGRFRFDRAATAVVDREHADDPAAVTVDVDESAIAGQVIAALSPATLAQQIVAAGVAKAVADELSKRLAS